MSKEEKKVENKNEEQPKVEHKEQKVTPYDVEGGEDGIDYNKLIQEFGTTPISQELINRFEKITGKKCHHWIRRGIFFSHRVKKKKINYNKKKIMDNKKSNF